MYRAGYVYRRPVPYVHELHGKVDAVILVDVTEHKKRFGIRAATLNYGLRAATLNYGVRAPKASG